MAEVRGIRKTRVGMVVSDKMDKTVVVEIRTRVRHPVSYTHLTLPTNSRV